jgi:hypothetical protein
MVTKEVAMETPIATLEDRLSDDLIWGVRGDNGIAAFLGIDERKCRHLIDRGALPVKRLAHRTLVASKSELRRTFGGVA